MRWAGRATGGGASNGSTNGATGAGAVFARLAGRRTGSSGGGGGAAERGGGGGARLGGSPALVTRLRRAPAAPLDGESITIDGISIVSPDGRETYRNPALGGGRRTAGGGGGRAGAGTGGGISPASSSRAFSRRGRNASGAKSGKINWSSALESRRCFLMLRSLKSSATDVPFLSSTSSRSSRAFGVRRRSASDIVSRYVPPFRPITSRICRNMERGDGIVLV